MKSRASALYFTSFQNYTKDVSPLHPHLENRLPRAIYMKITIIINTWIFTLFPNLIAKESYDRWVTRRVWGFRHQISKEKYLKMSVRKLQENTAALCKMAAKFSQQKDNIFATVQHSAFNLE